MSQLTQTTAKAIRESLSLSQAMVASETGVNRAYISQYEGGRRVLEDRDLEALERFYIQEGWDPAPDNGEQPLAEVAGFRMVDGFTIIEPESEEDMETLIQEYYDNADSIAEMRTLPVEREFFFGGLAKESTTNKALPLLTLYARQQQIKDILQGRMPAAEALDADKVQTLGDFIDQVLLGSDHKEDRAA